MRWITVSTDRVCTVPSPAGNLCYQESQFQVFYAYSTSFTCMEPTFLVLIFSQNGFSHFTSEIKNIYVCVILYYHEKNIVYFCFCGGETDRDRERVWIWGENLGSLMHHPSIHQMPHTYSYIVSSTIKTDFDSFSGNPWKKYKTYTSFWCMEDWKK